MEKNGDTGSLTDFEKKIVKALVSKKWRNQDIQALINIGRVATINSGRITEVKKNPRQKMALDDEVKFYQLKKKSYDPKTGLNLYDDERLIRAREAMILAVQIYNSAALNFKSEVFSVLCNIAWTYILHEYYEKQGVSIMQKDGRSLPLSNMIKRSDSPLTNGIKNNLNSMKIIRDDVEHKLLGKSDLKWQEIFQACCLNFEKVICELFGPRLSLASELSFALQFQKMNIDQLSILNKYEIPAHIRTTDARLSKNLTLDELNDLEYQFRVVYTLDSATKSRSHIEFIRPESAEGKEIHNILVQPKIADDEYPYKPNKICELVSRATNKKFTTRNHTQAWKLFKVRPASNAKTPDITDKKYCIYHQVHKDYTYSDEWLNFLIDKVKDQTELLKIIKFKL